MLYSNENIDAIKNDSDTDKMKDFCVEKISLHIASSSSTLLSVKTELSKTNMNENSCNLKQGDDKTDRQQNKYEKKIASELSKEIKSKYGVTFHNKSAKNNKVLKQHPLSKRKCAPNNFTNASTKIVLFERNVEIKDLESKVKYLRTKIKELENENRTVQGIQSRQERELKKFKEGVADIPSLLRGHKEEVKVYESTISNLRKELKEHQKEMKCRNESLLKKDNQIDKLIISLKRNEKMVHDFSSEIKELKIVKKDLEEKNKLLTEANENLITENEDLLKKNKDLLVKVQNLEKSISSDNGLNKQLKEDLYELQQKYEAEKNKPLEVSTKQQTTDPEEQINCDSSKILTESSHGSGLKNESTNLEDRIVNTTEKKTVDTKKSVDKTKNALIHTFNVYQKFCNTKLTEANVKAFGTVGVNNQKLLPPIKTTSKSCSQTVIADLGIKDTFSSPIDLHVKDRSKCYRCEDLAKDFRKVTTEDSEIDKPENKTSPILSISLKRESPNYFDEPLKILSKFCPNIKPGKKAAQSSMKTDVNEIHKPEIITSKDLKKEGKHCSDDELSKVDSRIWESEDLGKDAQCKLITGDCETNRSESKIILNRDEEGSTYWQNEDVAKKIQRKSTTCDHETGSHENKISISKQKVKTDKYILKEPSKKNSSESNFDTSWLDN